MKEKIITIKNKNNEEYEVEVILCFEIPEFNKKYIVYSYPNEKVDDKLIINSAELIEKDNYYMISDIENDKEWEFLIRVMAKIVNSKED